MARFYYQAISRDYKKERGHLQAHTLEQAKEQLRARQLLVTKLEAVKERRSLFFKRELSRDDLLVITTQLAELLEARMPLYESLISLQEQYQDQYRGERLHTLLLSLSEKIKEGSSLSIAMSHFPRCFPRLYIAMVRAGESVGLLDQTLKYLATLLNKEQKIKKKLISALIYPFVLTLFSSLVILTILTFVIPSIESILAESHVNHFTATVIWTSHLLTDHWPLLLATLSFLGGALYLLLRNSTRRMKAILFFLHLPLIRTLIAKTSAAYFTRTLSTLLQGRVAMIEALDISKEVLLHPLIREEIERAKERIVEGSSLSIELKKSLYFPPLVARMCAIGEESGKIGPMLEKMAELYEEEVDKSLTRLVELIQPIILLLMGLIVGVIMLAVLIPLTDTNHFM